MEFTFVDWDSRRRWKSSFGCWAGGDSSDAELMESTRHHPGIPTCLLISNANGPLPPQGIGGIDVKRDINECVRNGDVETLVNKWDSFRG